MPDLDPHRHAAQDGAPTPMLMTTSGHTSIDEEENAMDMRCSITPGTLAVLLGVMVIPAAVAETSTAPTASPPPNAASHSARIAKIPVYNSPAKLSDVDCIGDGANCVGYLSGTQGEVDVTNNTNPHYYWRFKLTCEFGGDQYSGANSPSAGTVKSYLGCGFGAPAKYWNVLVDYKP